MDTFAALALATDPAEPAAMKRPPHRPTDFIVTREMLRQIVPAGETFLILPKIGSPDSEIVRRLHAVRPSTFYASTAAQVLSLGRQQPCLTRAP
jgi:hypothetical protein